MPGGLVEYRSGPAAHAINRRRMGWRLSLRHLPRRAALRAPDPTGPRDETVHILTFTDGGKRPVALLWSYACHPVTFAEPSRVSADYPGVVRRALRAAFGAADRGVPGSGRHVAAAAGGARPRDRGPLGRAGGGVRAHTALPRAGHRDPRRLHGHGIRIPPIGADAGPTRLRRRRLHGSIRHRGAVPARHRGGGTTGLGRVVAGRRGITLQPHFPRTALPRP